MKICIPVKENKGLESTVFSHFGSAEFFLIYNSETEELKAVENGDLNHEHGMCEPLKAVANEAIDAVLVGGIGAGAIKKLNDKGIRVYQVADTTILNNIELLKQGKLPKFTLVNCCSHHNCNH